MVEKDTVVKENVKYEGLGDLTATYKYARDWFQHENFILVEDSYSEKLKGNGKEIEIEWTATKKITDYFKITLRSKWRILAMTEVEVEIEGKKKRMDKFGELKIEIKGILEKDYFSKWAGSPTHKFLKEVYHKYVIPERTYEKENKVREVTQDFKEEMKAFLELAGRR